MTRDFAERSPRHVREVVAPDAQLLERDGELVEIHAWVNAVLRGAGRLAIISGPAGIGKSSLLEAACGHASGTGLRVLRARGAELEQEFAFGVVRQLFEPLLATADAGDREQWLRGAAALAAPVIDPRYCADGVVAEANYRLLHGLYWLLANVADDGPLAVVIDDAQWADDPSLRMLSFLVSRLQTLPVLLLLGARSDRRELDRLYLDPAARVIEPAGLTEAAVEQWLLGALARPSAPEFARACREATGGNPFLLRELAREISREQIPPDAHHAQRVGSLSSRGVTMSVLLRLAGLAPAATALARAVAVLEEASLEQAATIAGLDATAAGDAVAALTAANVLAPDPRLRFVHPIVRTAIYEDISPAQRGAAHQRAAQLLVRTGAGSDQVAAHLMLAPPGSRWAVEALREAARQAAGLGAAATAVTYLQRALSEAGDGRERVDLLIELGQAGLEADWPDAIERLREAVTLGESRAQVIRAAAVLARGLRYRGQALEAIGLLQRVGDRLEPGEEELIEQLDLELLACRGLSASARLALAGWVAQRLREPAHPPQSNWEHLSVATLALDSALSGQPVTRVESLADRATAGLDFLADAAVKGQAASMAGLAYLLADRFDRAASVFEGLVQSTAQRVLAGRHSGMLANRASLHLRCGRLEQAQADAGRALELGREVTGARTLLPRAASVLVSVAAEQGTVPPTWLMEADIDPDSLSTRLLMHSRAELLLAQGHLQAAVDRLLAYGRRNQSLGWDGVATPWRSQAALALRRLGRPREADELLGEELELARAQGSARSLGIALRAAGLLARGVRREATLRQAVDALADSGASLEHARALVSLGIERRHRGATESARNLLGKGHDLAHRCSATKLADVARSELRLAGARPRRLAVSGPGSLTPSERRVVELVAGGMTNREVAQSLFLTEKTIETHLGHAYAKLGIRSRQHLAGAISTA